MPFVEVFIYNWSIARCIAIVWSDPSPGAPKDLTETSSSSLCCKVLLIGDVEVSPVVTVCPPKYVYVLANRYYH